MMNEIRQLVAAVDRLAAAKESVQPSSLQALAVKLKRVADNLAPKIEPVRLVIALHDTAPGLDQNAVVIAGSTAQVTVLVVDHRVEARERLFVVSEDPIDNPKEIVEVVSDEAAAYLQLHPELTEIITKHC